MDKSIPKNPLKFGMFATKPHIRWATLALTCVFIATALDRLSVLVLRNFVDSFTPAADFI